MANEMIERVARAIADNLMVADWDSLVEDGNEVIVLKAARAALEVMMEPTPEMIKRGSTTWCRWNNDDGPYDPEIPDIWQAMLSAALGQPRPVDEKEGI